MENVSVAFEFKHHGSDWTKTSIHLVWDVKMDFTRKTRWVKDGHKTSDIVFSSFAGVVTRKSVCITLSYAALNDVSVVVANIQNAYLQAPSSEKHCIICGGEFGEEHQSKFVLNH